MSNLGRLILAAAGGAAESFSKKKLKSVELAETIAKERRDEEAEKRKFQREGNQALRLEQRADVRREAWETRRDAGQARLLRASGAIAAAIQGRQGERTEHRSRVDELRASVDGPDAQPGYKYVNYKTPRPEVSRMHANLVRARDQRTDEETEERLDRDAARRREGSARLPAGFEEQLNYFTGEKERVENRLAEAKSLLGDEQLDPEEIKALEAQILQWDGQIRALFGSAGYPLPSVETPPLPDPDAVYDDIVSVEGGDQLAPGVVRDAMVSLGVPQEVADRVIKERRAPGPDASHEEMYEALLAGGFSEEEAHALVISKLGYKGDPSPRFRPRVVEEHSQRIMDLLKRGEDVSFAAPAAPDAPDAPDAETLTLMERIRSRQRKMGHDRRTWP